MQTGPLDEAAILQAESEALGDPSRPRSALCISGGGIRSATFALGVLQGLAERGLLRQFDYLSTVSGGGYIGSWLSAWIHRAGGVDAVEPQLHPAAASALHPVEHLRQYNSYLTPKLGAFSADTWTLAAIVTRNLLLNWLVLLPLLVALALLPRVLVSFHALDLPWNSVDPIPNWPAVLHFVFWAGSISFTASIFSLFRLLPSVGQRNAPPSTFVTHYLVPLLLSAVLFSLHYWWEHAPGKEPESFWSLCASLTAMCALAWLLFLIFCARGRAAELLLSPFSLAVVILGFSTAAATWMIAHFLIDFSWQRTMFFAAFSIPMLLAGKLLGLVIFAGFASRHLRDRDLEWLARAAAFVLLAAFGWLSLCVLTLVLPFELTKWERWAHAALAAGGGAAGLITAFLGQAASSAAGRFKQLALQLALPAFVLTLFTSLGIGLDYAIPALGLATPDSGHTLLVSARTPVPAALGLLGLMLLLSWLSGLFININTFSLHGMYRNRLIRAYLAASNPGRRPNPFTGFDSADNLAMSALRGQRPLHVLNLTLNLAATNNLAWQQRKAESFSVSPWHCGHPRLGYRDSAHYGGSRGISLGTAMTISGAAASPNMGYNTSSLVSFIMMLFNARLGAWLGNPGPAGHHSWRHAGPHSAFTSVIKEALTLTDDASPYVYLSDGGHFENLALYEMLRRRCRFILAVDGGADPDFAYDDLGNALRKIRIDFGVSIDFLPASLAALRDKTARFALGRVRYSLLDPNAADGVILYLKPMLAGNESPDVSSYAATHTAFPHESTADQFFDESQTESYRALGLQTVRDVLAGLSAPTIEEVFSALEASLSAPPPA